jgi:hypothetical protein
MINDTMDRVDGPASPDFCHSDTLNFVLPDNQPEAVNAVGENEYCTPLFIATKVEAAPISTAVPIRGLAIIARVVGAIAAGATCPRRVRNVVSRAPCNRRCSPGHALVQRKTRLSSTPFAVTGWSDDSQLLRPDLTECAPTLSLTRSGHGRALPMRHLLADVAVMRPSRNPVLPLCETPTRGRPRTRQCARVLSAKTAATPGSWRWPAATILGPTPMNGFPSSAWR